MSADGDNAVTPRESQNLPGQLTLPPDPQLTFNLTLDSHPEIEQTDDRFLAELQEERGQGVVDPHLVVTLLLS